MKDNNKLAELIEQAACSTNMLEPTDFSEFDKLQKIIDEIKENIAEITDAPANLIKQAKGSTTQANRLLKEALENQTEDASKSIKSVCKVVSTLQGLIGQIEQSSDTIASQKVESEAVAVEPEKVEPEVEQVVPETVEPAEVQEHESYIIPEDDVPLVIDFIAESGEHIDAAETGLLELETKQDDKEILNLIFRSFHTIKGMAGFMNLTDIGSLAHSAENLLDMARKGELVLADKNTDVIFESIDMLKRMITDLKESIEASKAISVQECLPQLLEKLKLAAQGQDIQAAPDTSPRQKDDEQLDEILDVKDEPKSESVSQKKTKAIVRSGDEKIKVSTARLDNLINMAGELVIAQLMVAEDVNTRLSGEHGLNSKVAHQGKIVRDLQELSMSMRMVPIAGVFQKMARLVRDLSHKADKKIDFVTQGEDTELDRNIVDKIADPLVHMIRNSADHGIESSQQRLEAGKNPVGKIELRAFHQAGNIIIEIEDDGKGLNKEQILKKAIDNGLVDANHDLSDEEIYKLIFHAGLSTAKKVTSVSGRGVGMDVVRKNIESLGGKVDISSTLGKGTVFTIRLPLTLAIIDGQIVTVGDERYIIPINSIVRTLRPRVEQISSIQSRGEVMMEQGELLPLVRLHNLFNVVPATKEPTESLLVIVEEDGRKCCLLVNELLGQQQVVIKSLGEGLGKAKGVSGGAIMGDGKVSLILDIPGLMELAQN